MIEENETSLKQASLCFLVKDNQVLLAMKKRGFATGKFNGIGGKKNPEETIEETAKRETFEEIGVTVLDLEKVATLKCLFQENSSLGQLVTVFMVRNWLGEPTESEEMAPTWFELDKIPFDKMWADERLWLPMVLTGKKLNARFVFGQNDTLLEKRIEVLEK